MFNGVQILSTWPVDCTLSSPQMTSPMGDSQGPAVCLGYGQILVLK